MKQRLGRITALTLVALFLGGAGFDYFSAWEMTQPGYVALGILLTGATLWISEAVPLFVTSLLILFLTIVWLAPDIRAHGVDVSNEVFLSPFFSDIILLFLGGFVLSAALHKLGLDAWLARAILRRSGRSVPRLLMAIMLVTAFLSMWLSNTATAAMMLALVLPIVRSLPASHPHRKALLLSVPFAANVGGLGTPIGSPPNAIGMQYMSNAGIAPTFGTWMLIGIPGAAVMLVLTWGVLLVVFRGSSDPVDLELPDAEIERSPALYAVAGITILTVLGWMTGGLHGQSSGVVALIPVILFFGAGLLNVTDLRSLPWDVLLLMGGGLCLGVAMSRSGLADWLVGLLPVSGVEVFWLMVVFGAVAALMSSLMSNTATANLIMPIILGLAADPISPILIGVAFACSLAMPLPVSTPPNAMAFSSGELSVGDMVRPGTLLTVAGIALAFTTGYWWWRAVGLF